MQDAERRQAEARAKQQQRQKEMEAAQQEAQERRQLLEEQKLLKLAGMPPASYTARQPHCISSHVSFTCLEGDVYQVALCTACRLLSVLHRCHTRLEACMFVMNLLGCLQGEGNQIVLYHVNLIIGVHLSQHAPMQDDLSLHSEQV